LQLELAGFDEVRPKIERHRARHAGYQPNQHELDGPLRDGVTQRWRAIIERYGYSVAENPAVSRDVESLFP
jgi:hypothetical protein